MPERHKPPKYVVKAIKKIHEYCSMHISSNQCHMCPYFINNNSCIFKIIPESNIWKEFINKYEKGGNQK